MSYSVPEPFATLLTQYPNVTNAKYVSPPDATHAVGTGDGSAINPYRGIQTAVDSFPPLEMPPPAAVDVDQADLENVFRTVIVNAGYYDENVTITEPGAWAFLAAGNVFLISEPAFPYFWDPDGQPIPDPGNMRAFTLDPDTTKLDAWQLFAVLLAPLYGTVSDKLVGGLARSPNLGPGGLKSWTLMGGIVYQCTEPGAGWTTIPTPTISLRDVYGLIVTPLGAWDADINFDADATFFNQIEIRGKERYQVQLTNSAVEKITEWGAHVYTGSCLLMARNCGFTDVDMPAVELLFENVSMHSGDFFFKTYTSIRGCNLNVEEWEHTAAPGAGAVILDTYIGVNAWGALLPLNALVVDPVTNRLSRTAMNALPAPQANYASVAWDTNMPPAP